MLGPARAGLGYNMLGPELLKYGNRATINRKQASRTPPEPYIFHIFVYFFLLLAVYYKGFPVAIYIYIYIYIYDFYIIFYMIFMYQQTLFLIGFSA